MAKVIKYDTDVSEKLLSGVEKTTAIVSKTMGPVASNVIISEYGSPRITKDGITVIRAVEFKDKFENTAAQLIREASDKTNTQAGDGTTGTAVLLESIFRNGLKHTNVGGNKIQIRNGITKAANKAIELIKESAKPISTKEEIRNVAKISSNHSDEIADVLADVFDKIGIRGVIKVEEGNTTETVSNIVDGCQYDEGYISPFFCTNDKMEADLDNPFTVFINKKLSNVQEMLPMLQAVSQAGKPLFIMCEDMEGEALNTIVMNKLRGFPVCVVKSPSYGDNKKAILQDLAILTHSTVVDESTGIRVEDALPGTPIVGTAKRIIVTKDNTTIIGGSATKQELAERIKSLDVQIENCKEDYDREKLEERRAKLEGGVAVISVGGKTKSELKEKKDLVDDAFNAVKAALKNGIVAGGGVALLNLKGQLEQWLFAHGEKELHADESIGARIFIDSLDAPIKTILKNAGESADVIISKITSCDDGSDCSPNYGYDVLNKKYCDLVENGVIDPASVIISEVDNASSIAGILLTTSAAVIDVPEEKTSCNSAPQGGCMPGMC